jgi:poly-gamma-glutamate capsule biosynthesis protein CapA/YwtB (metallophosphatase superfamily)
MITTVPRSSDLMSYRLTQAFVSTLTLFATIPAVSQRATNDQARMLFTGDILLSRQVAAELKHRGRSPWVHFHELFHDAEWVGGNFEGAVGPGSECVSSKSPCFAVLESDVDLLKNAGFRALTVENNHAGDLGAAGRKRTLEAFQQAGLLAVDFENSPRFIQLAKFEIALIAVTTIPPADGRVQLVPSAEVLEKLRLARLRANVVVVSIHWGNELVPWPSEAQRKQATWLVEHGADLVLGHHPHLIQRPECVAGRPVFFSLGNHVFDQANPKTKEGLIADCRLEGGRLHCQAIRTHVDRGTSVPRLSGPDRPANLALKGCAPRIKNRSDN